jgi:hypothetical protein
MKRLIGKEDHMFGSKSAFGKLFAFVVVLMLVIGTTGCKVSQTEEGKMPDVDVKVEDGKVPEYDVDAADVEVTTETKTIEVPDVNVTMPEDKNETKPPQQ